MGVNILNKSETKETAMGYGRFMAFRTAVASRLNKQLASIYGDTALLFQAPDEWEAAMDVYYTDPAYSQHLDVIDFLCMSDCGGEISPDTSKKIADILGADLEFKEVKEVLMEAYKRNEPTVWY